MKSSKKILCAFVLFHEGGGENHEVEGTHTQKVEDQIAPLFLITTKTHMGPPLS
jgi:hypothetical protein